MQDIADRVHVSRSTVSLVLSGKAGSRVSEEVKKKVRQAAKDLNYHINDVARSLRTGASKLIAVIITDISNEFFGRLTHRIQEAAQKEGYLVLMINTNEDPVQFENMVRVLIGRKVDVIIAVPPPGGEETVPYVQEMGVPIATSGFASADLAITHPSLFERTTKGFSAQSGRNTFSQEAKKELQSTNA